MQPGYADAAVERYRTGGKGFWGNSAVLWKIWALQEGIFEEPAYKRLAALYLFQFRNRYKSWALQVYFTHPESVGTN